MGRGQPQPEPEEPDYTKEINDLSEGISTADRIVNVHAPFLAMRDKLIYNNATLR